MRINGSMKNRFYFGNMKGGMNPPVRWRKFEADRHQTNDLGDSVPGESEKISVCHPGRHK